MSFLLFFCCSGSNYSDNLDSKTVKEIMEDVDSYCSCYRNLLELELQNPQVYGESPNHNGKPLILGLSDDGLETIGKCERIRQPYNHELTRTNIFAFDVWDAYRKGAQQEECMKVVENVKKRLWIRLGK